MQAARPSSRKSKRETSGRKSFSRRPTEALHFQPRQVKRSWNCTFICSSPVAAWEKVFFFFSCVKLPRAVWSVRGGWPVSVSSGCHGRLRRKPLTWGEKLFSLPLHKPVGTHLPFFPTLPVTGWLSSFYCTESQHPPARDARHSWETKGGKHFLDRYLPIRVCTSIKREWNSNWGRLESSILVEGSRTLHIPKKGK